MKKEVKAMFRTTRTAHRKYRHSVLGIVFFIFILAPLTSFAVETHFPVYDALNTKNKPDLAKYGLIPLRVLYSSSLWNVGESRDEPNIAKIKALASTLTPNAPVCVDIEHWPVTGKPDAVNTTIFKLNQVISTIRSNQPTAKIGFYGVLPIRDYWRAVGAKGIKRQDQWLRENMALKSLAQSVDIVFPSLYTFYNDPEGWEKYAIQNIKEAKKYGRPVYVFLWPEFHDSTVLKGQNIPSDFWRMQLEICRKYADGIVLWGKSSPGWDDNAPWWLETVKFINAK
jgi:hypothetical protein